MKIVQNFSKRVMNAYQEMFRKIQNKYQGLGIQNVFLSGRRSFQQYPVDSYVKIEKDRIKFCRDNQKELRAESYEGVVDHINNIAHDMQSKIGKSPRQKKGPLDGNVSTGLHFQIPEIDSPMPAKIRFPEGMDSPCQLNFGDLSEREKEVINISKFSYIQHIYLLRSKLYNIDGFDFAQTWQINSEKTNEQFECLIIKIRSL